MDRLFVLWWDKLHRQRMCDHDDRCEEVRQFRREQWVHYHRRLLRARRRTRTRQKA